MANSSVTYGLAGFGVIALAIVAVFALGIEMPLWTVAVLGILAMAVLIVPVAYVKRPSVTIDGSTVSITASGVDLRINTTDLRSVEFRDKMTTGFLQKGHSNGWMISGTCNNPEFGDYTLCADTDLPAFVVVRYKGQVVVFNLKTVEETESICEQLKARVPEHPRRR